MHTCTHAGIVHVCICTLNFFYLGGLIVFLLLFFSYYSDEELEHYLNDEDAVVQIDQYISKLEVVSSLLVMQSDESKL